MVGPSTSWEENHPGDSGGQWNSEMDHVGTESAPLPAQVSRPRVQFSGIEEKSDQKTRPRVKRSSKARVGCPVPPAVTVVEGVGLMLWAWHP